MTLIIAAACSEFVVQVSDRRYSRLTKHGTQLANDESNKEVIIRALDADFAVSFTGLASIAGKDGPEWIIDELSSARAPGHGFDACVDTIRIAAHQAFSAIDWPEAKVPRQAFVFAGFAQGQEKPRIAVVTNYLNVGYRKATPSTKFVSLHMPVAKASCYCFGAVEALDPNAKRRIKKVMLGEHFDGTTIDAAVSEIRKAATHQTYGKYIGKQCMSISIFQDGRAEAMYLPTHSKPLSYGPSLIEVIAPNGAQMVMQGVFMSPGGGGFGLGAKGGGLKILDRRTIAFETAESALASGIKAGKEGNHQLAFDIFSRIVEKYPNHVDAVANRAEAMYQLGGSEAALAEINRAIILQPNYASALYRRSVIRLNAQDYTSALNDIDTAIEASPNAPAFRVLRGVILNNLSRPNEALLELDTALRMDGKCQDALYNRGTTYMFLENYTAALADFDSALELNADDARALCNRGSVLLAMKHYEAAIRDSSRSIELDTTNPIPIVNRAMCHYSLGDLDSALNDYDLALALEPNSAGALFNRACIFSIKGEVGKALADLRRAISLDGQYLDLARTDPEFEGIRDDPRFKTLVG